MSLDAMSTSSSSSRSLRLAQNLSADFDSWCQDLKQRLTKENVFDNVFESNTFEFVAEVRSFIQATKIAFIRKSLRAGPSSGSAPAQPSTPVRSAGVMAPEPSTFTPAITRPQGRSQMNPTVAPDLRRSTRSTSVVPPAPLSVPPVVEESVASDTNNAQSFGQSLIYGSPEYVAAADICDRDAKAWAIIALDLEEHFTLVCRCQEAFPGFIQYTFDSQMHQMAHLLPIEFMDLITKYSADAAWSPDKTYQNLVSEIRGKISTPAWTQHYGAKPKGIESVNSAVTHTNHSAASEVVGHLAMSSLLSVVPVEALSAMTSNDMLLSFEV